MGEEADRLVEAMLDNMFVDDHMHERYHQMRNAMHKQRVNKHINKDANMTKELDIVTLFQMQQHDVKLAKVAFEDGRQTYIYKVPTHFPKLSLNMRVVVPGSNMDSTDYANQYKCAKFCGYADINDLVPGLTYKWLVSWFAPRDYVALRDNDNSVRHQIALNDAIAKAKAAVENATAINWLPKSNNLIEDDSALHPDDDPKYFDLLDDEDSSNTL